MDQIKWQNNDDTSFYGGNSHKKHSVLCLNVFIQALSNDKTWLGGNGNVIVNSMVMTLGTLAFKMCASD